MKLSPNPVLAALLCAIPVILFTGCTGRAPQTHQITIVKTDTVRSCDHKETIEFPGRVKAAEEVNLSFQIAGKLAKVYADEGMYVRKGSIIAELDDRDYKLQFSAAEAEYNSIKAEAERIISLYRDSVTTASNYDKARYGLQQIQAKYDNCRNQLQDTKIYAPFSGKIQKRFYDAPAVIGAGMPVASMISTDMTEISINVPASEFARLPKANSYSASFDFIGKTDIPLTFIGISPKANANQLYTARFAVGKAEGIAPGMNAMVKVVFDRKGDGTTLIPSSALFSTDGKSRVWICGKDGTVTSREVTIGQLHSNGDAVILSGLASGECIVTSGVHTLSEGEKVTILKPTSATNVGGLL